MESTADKAQRYHHGDLRPHLVLVGRALIESEARPSFRGLARAAGVSHSAPQHHFPTWSHVLAACAADGFRELSADLERIKSTHKTDPGEALYKMGNAYLAFADRSPAIFRLMFNRSALDVRTDEFTSQASIAYNHLARGIRDIVPSMTDAHFDYLINSIWAQIHGMSVLQIEKQICVSTDAGQTVQQLLRRGLEALLES